MSQIAFFINGNCIHWDAVVMAFSCTGAVCIFLSLYLQKSEDCCSGFIIVPVAVMMSLFFSRVLYLYGYGEINSSGIGAFFLDAVKYGFLKLLICVHPVATIIESVFVHAGNSPAVIPEGFILALQKISGNGYVLLGAFIGCALSAVVTKYSGIHNRTPIVLDCMSIAGCAGIAAGRLSSFFDTSNRGKAINSVFFSQWVQPVKNTVTGTIEYRFATFLLQSVVAGILFVALVLFDRKCKLRKDGDVTLLFSLLYCSSQFVLDSTRYDSMKMHSNGFISMVQIASMLTIIIAIVIVMMRLTRRCGFKLYYILVWGMILVLLGCAGFMEYYVQRYSNRSAFAYSVMSISLLCVCIITILAYFKQLKTKHSWTLG